MEIDNLKRIKYLSLLEDNLEQATRRGELEEVKRLVKQGADIDAGKNKRILSPLKIASIHGYLDIVKYLASKGVEVDAGTLLLAYESNHAEIVKHLISLQPSLYWITHQDKRARRIYKEYIKWI